METIFKTDLLTRICCKKQVRKCVLLEGRGVRHCSKGWTLGFQAGGLGSSGDPSKTARVTLSTCFMPLDHCPICREHFG